MSPSEFFRAMRGHYAPESRILGLLRSQRHFRRRCHSSPKWSCLKETKHCGTRPNPSVTGHRQRTTSTNDHLDKIMGGRESLDECNNSVSTSNGSMETCGSNPDRRGDRTGGTTIHGGIENATRRVTERPWRRTRQRHLNPAAPDFDPGCANNEPHHNGGHKPNSENRR
jgi:hypothetical protein